MNILFTTATRRWTGVKTFTLKYAKGLKKKGFNVSVAGRKKDIFLCESRKNNIKTFPIKYGFDFNPITIMRFLSILKKEKVDILITDTEKENRTAGIAAKILKIPVINRVGHIPDCVFEHGKLKTFREKFSFKYIVDYFFVPAEFMIGELLKIPFIKYDNIIYIPNGIDVDEISPQRIKPTLRKTFNIPEEKTIIGICSQVRWNKGFKYLLEAIKLLCSDNKNIILVIIGDGKNLEEVKNFSRKLSITNFILFTGFIENPLNYIADFDISILPTLEPEGMPNTLLEYAALCKPIIFSRTTKTSKMFSEKEILFLNNPQNSVEIKEKINLLILDKNLRQILSENIRKKVEAEFNLTKQIELFIEKLYKITNERKNYKKICP